MLIHWIVDGVAVNDDGTPLAELATNRYRAIIPAQGLGTRGHRVKLIPMELWVTPGFEKLGKGSPDVVVIGKLLPEQVNTERYDRLGALVIETIERMKKNGAEIIADINDDYFNDAKRGAYLRKLVTTVDTVTAGSPVMAQMVKRHCDTPIFVVGDPLGSPQHAPLTFRRANGVLSRMMNSLLPKLWPQPRLKLIWYGNAPNWPSMKNWMERLGDLGIDQPLTILVVSKPGIGIENFATDFNARFVPAAMIEFMPWEEDTVWGLVKESHIVLIPSDLNDASKSVKTSNRLTDALQCGRFVVASPVPAYMGYQDCAWLGDDLIEGIRWAISNPSAALDRIRRGQAKVAINCSAEAIAAAWETTFLQVFTSGRPPPENSPIVAKAAPAEIVSSPAKDDAKPVRLNLGCGDKVLEGYVNVDVAPSRRGMRPDVLCDLHDLRAFENDSADEILAVHVVEHFWRWEVLDILKEWGRVLKPGGKMILECPNLISACQTLLSDPENASAGDARGQKSMWVFYGDPSWQDPLMTHRWAYTPNSLAGLMREAGLVDVRQEPAQFKLREPRDMRVVGVKPEAGSSIS